MAFHFNFKFNFNFLLLSHLHLVVLLVLLTFVPHRGMVRSDAHDDFPEWDRVHWVVRSTDVVELPCYHSKYYPFNETEQMQNVQWILPEPTSYQHVKAGSRSEGWTVGTAGDRYTLTINKKSLNVPDAADGMYVCAALARVFPNITGNETYAWYYLRWGVGLYSNVPAMKTGSIAHKYYWCFTYAWVTEVVFITILALLALTLHFRYKGGPEMSKADEESYIDTNSRSDDEKISSSIKKSNTFEIDDEYASGKII